MESRNREYIEINFDNLEILGIGLMPTAFIQNPRTIKNIPLWKYGKCDINIDTGEISYLFDENNFNNT